jgi:tetratricopeptide (TPR) repeat protein
MILKSLKFLFLFLSIIIYSQNIRIADSLLKLINNPWHDTIKFDANLKLGNYFQKVHADSALKYHLIAKNISDKNFGVEWTLRKADVLRYLGWDYYLKGDYDSALKIYKISEEIVDKYLNKEQDFLRIKAMNIKSANLTNSGVIYLETSEYPKAIFKFEAALKIKELLGDKKGQSTNLTNLGIVYVEQGDYLKALDYYLKSLKIKDEIGDFQGKTSTLCNIGIIYLNQGNYYKALEYFQAAQNIDIKTDNKMGQSINLGNMGNVYSALKDYSKAMECYLSALKLDQEMGNKSGMARHLSNIGLIYSNQLNLAKKSGKKFSTYELAERALEFYFKAIKINDEIGNKRDLAINLSNVGNIYFILEKYSKAQYYLLESEKLLKNINNDFYLKDVLLSLSELFEQPGRYKDALYYYKEYVKARDSVLSEENRKATIVKEMKYNYEKEQALKEAEHQKELAVEKEAKQKQTVITWSVVAGLVLVVLFLGFVINRLNVTRKQKNIIEKQKQIVEEQKQIVDEQKKIVEQKNKDILDSINYARRIQNAILPSMAMWNQHLPECFVLYLPKDVIAGDFYWMEVMDNYIFVAAADCTGHGVPGALMSMLGQNSLQSIITENAVNEPAEILQLLDLRVQVLLHQQGGESNDGMDMVLVKFNINSKWLEFAGANRPLFILKKDGEFIEMKPDRFPIGGDQYANKIFTPRNIQLEIGDRFFMCSDGIVDQFGGQEGRKFTPKRLRSLIKDYAHLTLEQQVKNIEKAYDEWKSNYQQTDDVLLVGFEVK